jgi:hypothetical protein
VACGDAEPVEPVPVDPAHLEPPPTGQGFQIETEESIVEPGNEIQDCYFFRIGDLMKDAGMPEDQPFNLHRIQIGQREGSHHMNVFKVGTPNIKPDGWEDFEKVPVQKGLNGQGACFKSPLWADWPLLGNSQIDGQLDWTYPEGVANVLQPDDWIMLQSHYVNATSQPTPSGTAKVAVNMWHTPVVEQQLGTLFATKQSIRVCKSNPEPMFEGGCSFPGQSAGAHIIGANAHFHSRGKQFEMYTWDGVTTEVPSADARFYQSTTWDEPPMSISPELDVTLPQDGGVYYTCSFRWVPPDPAIGCEGLDKIDKEKLMAPKPDGTPGLSEEEAEAQLDCCYRFGPIVEKNEHCNIFVYYYPKTDDVNCF